MDVASLVPMTAQLVVAMLLGMIIGTERTLARKAAGLRTYGLVALGACLFIVMSLAVGDSFQMDGDALMRVVAGIVTGIGFLGAGVIILRDENAVGLTTAAGLWVAAGVGATVGFGFYTLAFIATILTLAAFTIFWFVERQVAGIVEEPKDSIS